MTQQPFSRPGAIDLSGLGRPAPQAGAPAPHPTSPTGAHSYSVTVDEQSFQGLLEQSTTAPVLLAFYSRSRMPESGQLADDLATVVEEHEGRYLLGLVDIDATPQIAQAMQIPSIPLVVAVVDGRPMPLLQDPLPIDELRTALTQVAQQLTAQGITGRHQPRTGAVPDAEGEEETVDPRYAPAQDALAAGDIDAAVAEYQKLVDANPADVEAAGGLAIAKVMQRTQGVDLAAARAAAADNPDDVDAQTMVADLDMLGGHVEDAFARLVGLVARTSDKDRERARDHLLGLFAAVGNDDPRVLAGRRNLASALF
ncbi:co-chaperone YbbN [Nocardioides sp. zg-1228]|uniref:co-chaperone YbbN n=1 Tax=Nocardioides sp. zg-1228 TaxID=2763008 RepID=UPI001642CBD7|nr:tetratricopeptide repeat protein [Nocardioides sp. zg-1228]MBC2934114.1 tetratricopeptide repeat protein [Nocardioides sp. zg-1228]QSF58862.1 tetratricopeptide repeat protein [Nocardioides sp. zg-1228]